jgi:hypothetical protein
METCDGVVLYSRWITVSVEYISHSGVLRTSSPTQKCVVAYYNRHTMHLYRRRHFVGLFLNSVSQHPWKCFLNQYQTPFFLSDQRLVNS